MAKTSAANLRDPSTSINRAGRKMTTSDRIKDLILSDGLRPGDLLPTEGELCERLGVSRSNVREAIRKLSTLDIVDVRHGHGTYVGEMSLDALVEALVFRGVLSPGDDLRALRDVVEVRAALDFGMSEAIVKSLQGTTNPKLSALVDDMVTMALEGKSFPQQDRAFHTGLLEALDNSLVGQLVAAFWDVHTAVLPRLNLAVAADLEQTARAHGQMLEAAQAGDVEAFHAAIAVHYEPIARALDRDVDRDSTKYTES